MADLFRYDINLSQLDPLINKLGKLADPMTLVRIMRRITAKIGVKAEELSGGYPPQPAPRHHPNSSEATQKRRLKPYRRTGQLGASLTSEVEDRPGGEFIAVLGSNKSYSPYVWQRPEDEPGQAWMHQGVWTPLAEAITRDANAYVHVAEEELYTEISAFLK